MRSLIKKLAIAATLNSLVSSLGYADSGWQGELGGQRHREFVQFDRICIVEPRLDETVRVLLIHTSSDPQQIAEWQLRKNTDGEMVAELGVLPFAFFFCGCRADEVYTFAFDFYMNYCPVVPVSK